MNNFDPEQEKMKKLRSSVDKNLKLANSCYERLNSDNESLKSNNSYIFKYLLKLVIV
jgi:hypothetical protein